MPLVQLTVVASALLGWSDIVIQPSRGDRAAASYRSVANLERPTERTVETLRRYSLEREYFRRFHPDVNAVLLHMEKLAQQRAEPELVYALAELSWIEGKRLERRREPQALDRYLDTAAYAFYFLFEDNPVLAQGRKPSDPRYRQAMELYNAGVDHLIRAATTRGEIRPENGKVISFKYHGGERQLQFVLQDSPWKPADVHKLLLATDFEVTGLNHDYNQYGLGVPLIAIRESGNDKGQREPSERFFPDEMAFPMTAYLVPTRQLKDSHMDQRESRVCRLQLLDPIRQQTVDGRRDGLAMQIDLTTPLAYMWSRTDLDRYRWAGLVRPEKHLERANLLLIRPYDPEKIPVVMVHGLISSPLAWIPMLNELLHDPEIYKRYQFFLYMYPTGVPIPIAAASLRDSLLQAREMYDPEGRNPNFHRMVLLGHSMGGLLSHMMSVDSGDELWRLFSDRRFDTEIVGPRDVLEELQGYLFFKPLPFVSRVVFMATPHRGSDLSHRVVGRVGTSLISDPDHIHKLLYQLVKANPRTFDTRSFRRFPTSIETLEIDSKMLLALLRMKPGSGVVYHSIIGSIRPTGVAESTDGVVRYTSSHVDERSASFARVASERVVRSGHGVQEAPEAIIEVRRILREHLGMPQPGPGPGVQEARRPADDEPVRLVPPATSP
jgi:pimeloyl-ACP methyl ester carboxylesterase